MDDIVANAWGVIKKELADLKGANAALKQTNSDQTNQIAQLQQQVANLQQQPTETIADQAAILEMQQEAKSLAPAAAVAGTVAAATPAPAAVQGQPVQ